MRKKNYQLCISLIMIVSTLIFALFFINKNIVPMKYIFIIMITIILVMVALIFWLFNSKKVLSKIVIGLIFILFIIGYSFSAYYFDKTTSFIKNITNNIKYQQENYSLIVLKPSSDKIEDYNQKMVGVLTNSIDSKKGILKELNTIIKPNIEDYNILGTLCIDLLEKKIDAILIEDSYINILEESDSEFLSDVKVIWTKDIKIEMKNVVKSKNITLEPFVIYISGIDTYGSISRISRSDVNIMAVVNPITYQILLVHIPRDYYMPIYDVNAKDKLTNSGIKGINNTIKTIEIYFELNINYYIKVNFNTVIQIVDVLDGIEVNSNFNFCEDKYCYKKGINYLNGEKALFFARARKGLPRGDRDRGVNQEKVLTAIINKLTSPKLITNFSDILTVLGDSFATNIEENEIKKFINFELDKLPSWKFESISVDGSDLYVYDSPFNYGRKSYVMEPDMGTVKNAQAKIAEYLKK